MSGFLIPFERVESQEGDRAKDYLVGAGLLTSFLLPLFTRTHAAKVFADMARKVASSKFNPNAVRYFVRNAPKIERNLLEAADLGLATAPDFSKLGYEGFLTGHGNFKNYRAAFVRGARPVIAIGSQASPFSVAHELSHFLTIPYRHRPAWVKPWADPLLAELEDPAVREAMKVNLYATAREFGLVPTSTYAEYLTTPEEALANAIAARVIPYRDELIGDFIAGSLLPRRYWPTVDALASFLKTGRRP